MCVEHRRTRTMNQALKQAKQERIPFQSDGIVVECGSHGIRVEAEDEIFLARRAVSCLVEPAIGDRVLIAGDLGGDAFVIAVLERLVPASIRVSLAEGVSLGVQDGRFVVAAARGMDFVSAKDMTLTASDLTLRAPNGRVFFDHLAYIGQRVFAQAEGIRLVGRFFDAVVERISHKVKRSYKVVEEMDSVRSEQIDYRATKNLSLRGENSLVTAKELVKIDGEQIHLG
jgi:hypothetical protein